MFDNVYCNTVLFDNRKLVMVNLIISKVRYFHKTDRNVADTADMAYVLGD